MDRRSTILVVDDEELNRSLLRALLSASFDVLEASSGVAALEILGRAPVDLVLLDVMMPELDGFATCKLIKAQPRDSLLPVILVTALGEQEDRNRGLESGADDFLRKPVDRRELLLRVRSFLRLRGQEQIIRGQVEERLVRLREVMARDNLKADVSCFWHGAAGEQPPAISAEKTAKLRALPAEIETDFDTDELPSPGA